MRFLDTDTKFMKIRFLKLYTSSLKRNTSKTSNFARKRHRQYSTKRVKLNGKVLNTHIVYDFLGAPFVFFRNFFRQKNRPLFILVYKKKQHPLSESRERERALLPSWCIFPNKKKSSQNTTTASEDVIYIYTNTYTRHTKHIAILYDSR